MKIICHRGNQNGKSTLENYPPYITSALDNGYDAEIDVWYRDNRYFLGHDYPQFVINEEFLLREGLWIHAKNIDALAKLHYRTNAFFHNIDDVVLTSNGYLWVYPNKPISQYSNKCVVVLKGDVEYSSEDLNACYGICVDDVRISFLNNGID